MPTGVFIYCGKSPDAFIAALTEIQELLPPTTQFAVRDHFTIMDATIVPFLSRWELQLHNDISKFAEGTGPRVYEELFQSEHFGQLQKYFANILSHESFKNSFDLVRMLFSPVCGGYN